MAFETQLTWLAVGFLVMVFVIRLIAAQTSRQQEKQLFQFWHRVGLPMGNDRVNLTLRRRLHHSDMATLFGGLAGALVAAALLFVLPDAPMSFTFIWLVAIPAILTGATAFDLAASLRDTLFGRRDGAPRMARVVAVSRADYMSPWRLRAAPLLMALTVLTIAAGMVLGLTGAIRLDGFLQGMVLPSFMVAVVVLTFSMLVGRRVLEQSQPVAEPLELAWDDAVRADVFRKMGLLAAILAWLALTSAGLGVIGGLENGSLGAGEWDSMATAVGQIIGMWGYFVILFVYSFGTSHSYFRYRLWPNAELLKLSTAGGE